MLPSNQPRFLRALLILTVFIHVDVACQNSTAELNTSAEIKGSQQSPSKEKTDKSKDIASIDHPGASFTPGTVLTWPRMRADKFGCMLEKTFRHRDFKFGCALLDYKNAGDPCKNTTEYYLGPVFPSAKIAFIDPLLADLELEWEHGELRVVTLTFIDKVSVSEITKRYGLPVLKQGTNGHTLAEGNDFDPFPNISSISIQACHKEKNCLILEGFDHMGAGEIDCDGRFKEIE